LQITIFDLQLAESIRMLLHYTKTEFEDKRFVCGDAPGLNFIRILNTNFSYECLFGSFFYLHVSREKLPKQRLYKKFVRKMLMKCTIGVKFMHQHFTSSFFVSRSQKHKDRLTTWLSFCTIGICLCKSCS